jgi:hypothetical protein
MTILLIKKLQEYTVLLLIDALIVTESPDRCIQNAMYQQSSYFICIYSDAATIKDTTHAATWKWIEGNMDAPCINCNFECTSTQRLSKNSHHSNGCFYFDQIQNPTRTIMLCLLIMASFNCMYRCSTTYSPPFALSGIAR